MPVDDFIGRDYAGSLYLSFKNNTYSKLIGFKKKRALYDKHPSLVIVDYLFSKLTRQ